jgi:hypothetical protein
MKEVKSIRNHKRGTGQLETTEKQKGKIITWETVTFPTLPSSQGKVGSLGNRLTDLYG